MKHCPQCGADKPTHDFYTNRAQSSGYQSQCKTCHRENVKNRQDAFRFKIREYKESHPCAHCGETDPVVLQFHHVRGKEFKVSYVATRSNWSTTLAEISKCDVLCANCHLRHHALEGYSARRSTAPGTFLVSQSAQEVAHV